MNIDIKKYIPIILKALAVISIVSLAVWLILVSGLTQKLLDDKIPKSKIDEGTYILNRLAQDYEDLLKQKREALDKETQFLLTEKGVTQTIAEKNEIQRRLNAIQNEKNALNEEYKKNLIQRAEIENTLKNLRQEVASTGFEKNQLNEKYLSLMTEKDKNDSYWKNYVNDLLTYFTAKYQDNPLKKAQIEADFKKDYGKYFILEQFNSLSNQLNDQQINLNQDKEKEDALLTDKSSLETKIKEYEKTIDYYNQYADVVKKFQNIQGYFNSANSYFKIKNFSKSAEDFKKVINELDEVRTSYENLLVSEKSIQNESAKRNLDIGLSFIKIKNYNKAIENLTAILKDTPDSDYTKDALSNIFKITNQLTDQQKIEKENFIAKNLMDKADFYASSKNYKDALKTYYEIVTEHPYSTYIKEGVDKSNNIREIIKNMSINNFTSEMKNKFEDDYNKFNDYNKKGDIEKARNYYFDSLNNTFGDYSNNTIYKFKEFEDKYIEMLINNYTRQIKTIKTAESEKKKL